MYGEFWIEYRDQSLSSERWGRYGRDLILDGGYEVEASRGGFYWTVAASFGELKDAIDAAKGWTQRRPNVVLRIVNDDEDGKVYWEDDHSVECFTPDSPTTAGGTPLSTYEEKKPLHIPTDKLIERLKERATEEKDRREAAEKAVADKRRELTEAIMALSEDELTNLLVNSVNSGAKFYEEAKKNKTYVSKESIPMPIETTLEKQIRVLEMASDKEVEVSPNEEIYNLL